MAKKRKGKRQKLSAMEEAVVHHTRKLVADLEYDESQDWGGITITMTSLRPHTVDGETAFVHRSGSRVFSEVADSKPAMKNLMEREMGRAAASSAAEFAAHVERTGADDMVHKDVSMPEGTTDQEACDLLRAEKAKEAGQTH